MASLKEYNTFGVDVQVETIHEITERKTLESFDFKERSAYLILGGGSNILFTRDVEQVLLLNRIKGKRVVQQSVDHVWVQAGGGETWHEFVLWCLEQGYAGLENLSLIPGTVGAAPIQNIGAYGVEVKDVITQVTAVDLLQEANLITFSNDQCDFSYRNSLFKSEACKGRYFITHVTFKLSKEFKAQNTSYGAIQSHLDAANISDPTAKDVSEAVIAIRESKLPDPKVLGNSGSFFKNPIVPIEIKAQIMLSFPDLPFYPYDDGHVKLPAGWLIDQCGWKGKQIGNTGCYERQALIIVNHGDATGSEILAHAERVKTSVLSKFGISLEYEVNIL